MPKKILQIEAIPIRYEVYDLEQLRQFQDNEAERIIDFVQDFKKPLTCLPVPTETEEYQVYLAVIPAEILAQLYEKYKGQLLEYNLRTFLGMAKKKVNQEINYTLEYQPEMFLAYNNGISATARSVELTENGNAIKTIRDLQIVNGGQTTAIIHRAFMAKGEDKTHLSKIFIQMKLSVIQNNEKEAGIIANISKYSNSQNTIAPAIFSRANPFLVALERISRLHIAPNSTYWFFERVAEQYQTETRLRVDTEQKRRFKLQNPKSQLFTKEEIARYYSTWEQKPNLTVRNYQIYYNDFIATTEKAKLKADDIFFETLIAKAILFKKVTALYQEDHHKKGAKKSDLSLQIVTYTLAWLSHQLQLQKQGLDFDKIWRNQSISETLEVFLHELMFLIEQFMIRKMENESIKLWAAKEDCWKVIKEQSFLDLEFIEMDLVRTEKVKKRIAKREAYWQEISKTAQLQLVQQVPSEDWDAIERWARMIKWTEYQINTIIMIHHAKILDNKLTDGQVKRGLEILNSYSKHQKEIAEEDSVDLDYLKITHDTLKQLLKWNSRRQEIKWKENMILMDFKAEHLVWSKEDRQRIWTIIKRFKGIAFKI